MEPESSSPYPQVLATRPYLEPTPSSPHDPLQLPEDRSRVIQSLKIVDNVTITEFPSTISQKRNLSSTNL